MGVPLFQETSIYTLYTEHIIVTYMHTIGIKTGLEISMVYLGRSIKNIAKDWAPNGPLKICCITRASSWYLLIKSAAGHIQRTNDTYIMCWTEGSDLRLLHKGKADPTSFSIPWPFSMHDLVFKRCAEFLPFLHVNLIYFVFLCEPTSFCS